MSTKNTLNSERLERMNALILRRLLVAGAEGIGAAEFSKILQAEFGSNDNVNRHRLVKMFTDGKIYRKLVSGTTGGRTGRYFLTEQWRDEHVDTAHADAVYIPKADAIPIPKYGVTERNPDPMELGAGIIIPSHVKVTVCDPYKSDYRITVDPASIPRHVDSSQCRDWVKA